VHCVFVYVCGRARARGGVEVCNMLPHNSQYSTFVLDTVD
jgi:hypothetical protein